MSVLVLGVGSPFGDDRVGWVVVERLRGGGVAGRFPDVRFEVVDRPGALLVAAFDGVGRAILIDAVDAGIAPGEVIRLVDEEISARAEALFSSHGLGIGPALQLGRALGRLPAELILYGIQLGAPPSADTVESPLSESVESAIDTLLPLIEQDLTAAG